MRIDVHQHLWTDGLHAVLARRTEPPRLRPRAGGWELELAGETPFPLASEPQDPHRRVAMLDHLGVDVALVALSPALGVEGLPEDDAREIIEAWDHDARALPGELPAWGSVPLADPDPLDVDLALAQGRIGITLPASAMSTPAALDRVGAVLERLARRNRPLLVHPGPAAPGTWLAPLTSDVASLSDAWHAWALHGRAQHPALRVGFAGLAGLAPLHADRAVAGVPGAPIDAALGDPLTFYDTSSYGPRAIEAMVRTVGKGSVVHGSDWPYAEPAPVVGSLRRALTEENPAALLRPRLAMAA